jgi:hypothetical protein
MMGFFLRLFGGRIVHKAVAKQIEGSAFDPKLGLALLRDRRIPFGSKALALALAGALVAALIALEVPFEAVLAALVIGIVPEGILDGLEVIIGPILFGCLLLPHIAPQPMVQQIRRERAGILDGPVIDVESRAPETVRAAHLVG